MILYYVRHGLPNYEEDNLMELGRYQADETSKFLATINFDMIFSSPLGRAKETASYLEKRINKTAIILPFANESIAHHYFHLLNEETNERQWLFFNPTWRTYLNELRDDPNWFDSKYFKEPRFKEATEYYSKEIDEWLTSIGIHHDKEKNTYTKIEGKEVPDNIVLFAHGGFAYAFLSYILGLSYPYFASHFICMNTCGVTEIIFDLDTKTARLNRYNDVHYDREKLT